MTRRWVWLVLILLIVPAFSLMVRPGIFTIHDPHLFRLYEFNQCIQDGVFPCRWSANSAKGFGVPLFNFYTQAPYLFTQLFIFVGFSILNSAKIVYALSLVLSGLTMFLYARRIWGQLGGLLSAVFYVYAPYRAVDVWVRGALPEALAFVLYPLILYFLDSYLATRKLVHVGMFSFCLALLINTHNLSFLMFGPFLFVYWLFKSLQSREFKNLTGLIPGIIYALALSAFYLLPVITENHLVTLGDTIKDYYNYKVHFTTLNELFISRYWGYGASLWAQKFLSVSIGQLHWMLPLSLFLGWLVAKTRNRNFILFFVLGIFALFLTHGKSSIIWNHVSPMKYIQFPWRFLSIAVLFTSLSAGFGAKITNKRIIPVLLIILVILFNFNFFRPDIWRDITDDQAFSGSLWDEGRSSSLTDFWPIYGQTAPSRFASTGLEFTNGEGTTKFLDKKSHSASAQFTITSHQASLNLPITFFPGWQVRLNDQIVSTTTSPELGLIHLSQLVAGDYRLSATFTNTQPRSMGNTISLLSLLMFPIWFLKKRLG